MKIFIYKSLIVFFFILVLFKLTIGSLVQNYEKKIDKIFNKESLDTFKIKIREEMKAGIAKDRILNPSDAILIDQFIKKIQKEIFESSN